MRSKPWASRMPGLVHTSLILPENLHEGMKAVRQARRMTELADTRLCRIYREAIEYYLASPRVRELLEHYSKAGRPRKRAGAAGPEPQEALCADR